MGSPVFAGVSLGRQEGEVGRRLVAWVPGRLWAVERRLDRLRTRSYLPGQRAAELRMRMGCVARQEAQRGQAVLAVCGPACPADHADLAAEEQDQVRLADHRP